MGLQTNKRNNGKNSPWPPKSTPTAVISLGSMEGIYIYACMYLKHDKACINSYRQIIYSI